MKFFYYLIRPDRRRHFFPLLAFIIVIASAVNLFVTALAAVTMVSFTAQGQNQSVAVRWQTATESDFVGFFLLRSLQSDQSFSQVGDFFFAQGSTISGASYAYDDTAVTNGTKYFYMLEIVNSNNVTETYGLVCAIPGASGPCLLSTLTPTNTTAASGQATLTPTPTLTGTPPTNTPTPTGTRITPSVTPTRTRRVTATSAGTFKTSTSQPFLLTQTRQPTSLLTGSGTPTLTPLVGLTPELQGTVVTGTLGLTTTSNLEPFPSITVEFPVVTTAVPLSQASRSEGLTKNTEGSGGFNIRRWGPLVLIGIIWVLLGVWFVSTLRRMN